MLTGFWRFYRGQNLIYQRISQPIELVPPLNLIEKRFCTIRTSWYGRHMDGQVNVLLDESTTGDKLVFCQDLRVSSGPWHMVRKRIPSNSHLDYHLNKCWSLQPRRKLKQTLDSELGSHGTTLHANKPIRAAEKPPVEHAPAATILAHRLGNIWFKSSEI